MIGLLTAVIGDLASHFGCTVGMKDAVTAISLVAMGTSIPGRPGDFYGRGSGLSKTVRFQIRLRPSQRQSRTAPLTVLSVSATAEVKGIENRGLLPSKIG